MHTEWIEEDDAAPLPPATLVALEQPAKIPVAVLLSDTDIKLLELSREFAQMLNPLSVDFYEDIVGKGMFQLECNPWRTADVACFIGISRNVFRYFE